MPVISRTRRTLIAAGVTLSLMLAAGISATDHARADPAAIVDLEQGNQASAVLAGFSTSPRVLPASLMAACTNGTHFPGPKLS